MIALILDIGREGPDAVLASADTDALPRPGDTFYASYPDEAYSVVAVAWHLNAQHELVARVHCTRVVTGKQIEEPYSEDDE